MIVTESEREGEVCCCFAEILQKFGGCLGGEWWREVLKAVSWGHYGNYAACG